MIKVHILAQCEHCNGEVHLPKGEAESYTGERLPSYLSLSSMPGQRQPSKMGQSG